MANYWRPTSSYYLCFHQSPLTRTLEREETQFTGKDLVWRKTFFQIRLPFPFYPLSFLFAIFTEILNFTESVALPLFGNTWAVIWEWGLSNRLQWLKNNDPRWNFLCFFLDLAANLPCNLWIYYMFLLTWPQYILLFIFVEHGCPIL